MNLVVDVGNSSTSFAVFDKGKIVGVNRIENAKSPDFAKKLVKSGGESLKKAIILSVQPKIERKIQLILKGFGALKVEKVSIKKIRTPKFKYKDVDRLGKDRVMNVYGAYRLVGGDCVVADFGTALTLDFLSVKGVFEGGFIFPGLETAIDSLKAKTALLPQVKLKGKISFPATSTEECIRSGVVLGYAALVEKMLEKFKRKYELKKCNLIVTGGHADRVYPYLKHIKNIFVDPYFTLKSLNVYARILEVE